ncbi:AAA family ATPase [Pseudarthrobacter sp. NPDC080039]|uniref:AAA family ATPase n=1 Tax=unclassified Pseudarthrobacter TaxID=2647000 RepID=UPI00344FAE07
MTSLLEQSGGAGTITPIASPDGSRRQGPPGVVGGDLGAALRASVQGQDEAVAAVVRAVRIADARLVPAGRPLAKLLFLGPTGVGKTQLVRALAAAIRTGEEDYCRVDMSSLAQEHYTSSITGAPPGYSGSKEGFSIFDRGKIESAPGMPGIVLFDEIEKAHSTVVRSLLHILDNGFLRLASGSETISFRNCIIVMTSNLAAEEIAGFRDRRARLTRALDLIGPGRPASPRKRTPFTGLRGLVDEQSSWAEAKILDRALRRSFDPEFLNRIDEIVRFEGIGLPVAEGIVRAELELLAATLRRRYIHLSFTDTVIAHLVDEGFSPRYGARALQRVLRRRLLPPLAEALAAAHPRRDQPLRVHAQLQDGHLTCRAYGPTAAAQNPEST